LTAPGLIVAAPSSGAGKTTITIGLMAAFRRSGLRVTPAKVGPDYIDPRYHDRATGRASVNLDGWAMRAETLDGLIAGLGSDADLILVEGVMGLFDGAPRPGALDQGSTADLAARSGWPVVLVVDAARQAQSVAALVHGFRTFRDDVALAGVILNQVGSDRHAAVLGEAIETLGLPVLGAVARQPAIARPSRHLGLEQAMEDPDLETYLAGLADLIEGSVDLERLREAAAVSLVAGSAAAALPPLGQRIAVTRDAAFGFTYPHVLEGWYAAGAELSFFSPLADEAPAAGADAVYLPGGYPELHPEKLANAAGFRSGMAAAVERGAWIFGECGGFMVLGEALVDPRGAEHPMLGLLPLTTRFDERRLHLGYRRIETALDTPFGPAGTVLRGHEFHYSVIGAEGEAARPFTAADARGTALGPLGLARDRVFGSYLHLIDRDQF